MQGKLTFNSNTDDYIFLDKLIPDDHFLKKVNQKVDLSFIGSITENLYCPNNGRPSIAPEGIVNLTFEGEKEQGIGIVAAKGLLSSRNPNFFSPIKSTSVLRGGTGISSSGYSKEISGFTHKRKNPLCSCW